MNKIIAIILVACLTLLTTGCITDTSTATVATSSSSVSGVSSSSYATTARDSLGDSLAAAYVKYMGKTIIRIDTTNIIDTQTVIFQPISKTISKKWVPIDSVCQSIESARPDMINPRFYAMLDSVTNADSIISVNGTKGNAPTADQVNHYNLDRLAIQATQLTTCTLSPNAKIGWFPTNHAMTIGTNALAVMTIGSIAYVDSPAMATELNQMESVQRALGLNVSVLK